MENLNSCKRKKTFSNVYTKQCLLVCGYGVCRTEASNKQSQFQALVIQLSGSGGKKSKTSQKSDRST
jgi:hypothetical protein